MKKYLFVCQQNRIRSPIAESFFERILKEKGVEAIVESAGLSDTSLRKLTRDIADSADIIFCMDDDIYKQILEKYYQQTRKLVNLDILDVYNFFIEYDEMFLKRILRDKEETNANEIKNRPEIMGRLSLYKVLEMKRCFLESFI